MPSNQAAWLTAAKENPFQVLSSPYPEPGPQDILIKNEYAAINPMDYKIQDYNPAIGGRPLTYPLILGSDVAGTVLDVGKDVDTASGLQVGAKVMAHVSGGVTGKPEYGGYQQYLLVPASAAIVVPSTMDLEKAVVLPLACDTATAGLFAPEQLGLSTAKLRAIGGPDVVKKDGDTPVVLVWGGSSSVGCCAIQLVVAAGYDVFAVASARNHTLCETLGASRVFDQTHSRVQDEIVAALEGRTVAGALDCIADSQKTVPACANVLARTNAAGKKKVLTVLNATVDGTPEEVEIQRVSIPSLFGTETYREVHDWLARALAVGKVQPKPDPFVVGTGLESIQLGIDTLRKGVSAKKVVIKVHE